MSSSSVYYKFKSQREPSRVTFDGTTISVWDLKREIIVQNKMGKGTDFDLGIYNPDTEEEYRDDSYSISRSSTVVVRRLPPSKPGRGTAQNYVADLQGDGGESSSRGGVRGGRDERQQGPSYRGPMSIRFDDRGKDREPLSSATLAPHFSMPSSLTDGNQAEADSIAAMFQATTDQWDATQEKMSHATFRSRGGGPSRGGGHPRPYTPRDPTAAPHMASSAGREGDRVPPATYVCYRCYQKGHWIQDCPTNQDPDWDNKPRLKRTTGIPKSMLKTVDAPTDEQRQAGVMITADGTYVVAQVDSATWENTRNQVKPLSRSDVFQSVPSDSSLACPLCSKLLRSTVQTPCCSTRYCEECIQNHLLDHDFSCPDCEKRIGDLTTLKRDDETRKRVETYVEEAVSKSEDEIKEREESEAKAKADREEKERKIKEEEEQAAKAGEGDGAEKTDPAGATTADGSSMPQHSGNMLDSSAHPQSLASGVKMPSNVPIVIFNPQLVQQLVMTLSNPRLPVPMRMMLQTQLQAQQMAFIRMQSNGGVHGGTAAGMPGMAAGPGLGFGQPAAAAGWPSQQNFGPMQQQVVNPMMGVVGLGMNGNNVMSGMSAMRMGMNTMPGALGVQNHFGNGSAMMGMGGMANRPMSGAAAITGGGMDGGAYNRGRNTARQQGGGGGGQKRERDTDFVELGGGDGNKMARTG